MDKVLITTKPVPVMTGVRSLSIHVNLDLPMVNIFWAITSDADTCLYENKVHKEVLLGAVVV